MLGKRTIPSATSMMTRLFLFCIVITAESFQLAAYFTLSPPGFQYQPSNTVLHLSTLTAIPTILDCSRCCLNNFNCRTFNFDRNTGTCQLFEGSTDVGSLVAPGSATVVGSIELQPFDYQLYHAPCNQCVNSRYLSSSVGTGLCECPVHTFWDGSMCLNQRFINGSCQNDSWCRSDLNLHCNNGVCSNNSAPLFTLVNTSTTTLTTVSTTSTSSLNTSTVTTASTATTTLTASLPCPATFSPNGILYNVTNPTAIMYNYTCFAHTWTATNTSATISFTLRNDPGYWSLDDVAVYHGTTQMLVNGGFESGMTGWTRMGDCGSYNGSVYFSSADAHSGSGYYVAQCVNNDDILRQTFSTVSGHTYGISFWLSNNICCSPTVTANIVVS